MINFTYEEIARRVKEIAEECERTGSSAMVKMEGDRFYVAFDYGPMVKSVNKRQKLMI